MAIQTNDDIKKDDTKLEKVLDRKNREILILKEISAKVSSSLDLDITLNTLLSLLDDYFSYRYSMVLLTDAEGLLTVFASHGYPETGLGAKVRFGKGIIGTVAKRKRMMNMVNITSRLSYMIPGRDIYDHPENEIIIKLPGLPSPKSQVAFPLIANEELVGVLSVESDHLRIFKEEDEEIISVISHQAATVIQKTRLFDAEKKRHREIHEMNERLSNLYKEQKKTLSLFAKYVPDTVVKKALKEKPESIFEGELLEIAVLFCDMRDFTRASENLAPNEVVFLLNTYYEEMAKVIKKYEGVINQFVGDEIFVTFGAPVSIPVCQEKAVLCALDMIDQLKVLNGKLKKSLNLEIKVGIGINFGPVVAGNLGSEDRIEYSITGDTVNTGKRIESLTKDNPNIILISETILSKTRHLIKTKAWDAVKVKGKQEQVAVYQILGKKEK